MSRGEIGAGAGANVIGTYKVPILLDNLSEGTIEYKTEKSTLDATPGFFVFTYYIRNSITGEDILKGSRLYLEGINAYRLLVKQSGSPFEGWKLIVYTDIFTYSEMKKTEEKQTPIFLLSQSILNDKDVLFAVVDWPKHQRREIPQINGPALRLMRTRAAFDFPTKYIFVRDADTLFENDLTSISKLKNPETARQRFANRLLQWEQAFYNRIPNIQEYLEEEPPLILGSHYYYKRNFHFNELTGEEPPYGVYAGFVNITPNIPIYQNSNVWKEIVNYMNEHSYKLNTKRYPAYNKYIQELEGLNSIQNVQFREIRMINGGKKYANYTIPNTISKENEYYEFSNNTFDYSIGRDEQVYLFIIIPQALDNVFFFKTDYGHYVENPYFFPRLNNTEYERYKPRGLFTDFEDLLDFHDLLKQDFKKFSQEKFGKDGGGKRKKRQTRKKRKTKRVSR